MELMGGVMIMLVLLGLLLSAVWLSLPILIVGLWRRTERIAARLEQLEGHLNDFEHRLDAHVVRRTTTENLPISNATEEGGVDGTAYR